MENRFSAPVNLSQATWTETENSPKILYGSQVPDLTSLGFLSWARAKKVLPSLSFLLFLPWSRYVLSSKCIRLISRSNRIFPLRQTFKPGNVAIFIKRELKIKKRNFRWRRKKSAGCVSRCHHSIISKTNFQHCIGTKTERAGTYQDIESRPLLIHMPTPPFPIHHLSETILKAVMNPTCSNAFANFKLKFIPGHLYSKASMAPFLLSGIYPPDTFPDSKHIPFLLLFCKVKQIIPVKFLL